MSFRFLVSISSPQVIRPSVYLSEWDKLAMNIRDERGKDLLFCISCSKLISMPPEAVSRLFGCRVKEYARCCSSPNWFYVTGTYHPNGRPESFTIHDWKEFLTVKGCWFLIFLPRR